MIILLCNTGNLLITIEKYNGIIFLHISVYAFYFLISMKNYLPILLSKIIKIFFHI